MKTKRYILLVLLFSTMITVTSFAQMTAMDFNRKDCNGNNQNLYSDLNSGKVVIMEYFMTSCAPCPAAGTVLENMKAHLLSQFPGKIKSYSIAFNNTYSCSTVINWVNTYSFTTIPMDSGAAQVAYYGGMGMPTIVIAAGSNHQLLGNPYIGFTNSDTTQMASNIRSFLSSQVGIEENSLSIGNVTIYPNPSHSELKLNYFVKDAGQITIELIDVTGKLVKLLSIETTNTGFYNRSFNIQQIPSGFYSLRISNGNTLLNKKITIVK